jgi:hypothetical protein
VKTEEKSLLLGDEDPLTCLNPAFELLTDGAYQVWAHMSVVESQSMARIGKSDDPSFLLLGFSHLNTLYCLF